MNLLVDSLPTAVRIRGQETPINWDFRAALRVILAIEDETLTGVEKQTVMLGSLYSGPVADALEACRVAVKFLNGGHDTEEQDEAPRVFSWAKDQELIYAAFRQTHGIDLQTVQGLHWWAFMALFMDLGADTAFCQLVNLRKRVKTGKATKEERQAAREMGEMFEVPEPDMRTLEERLKEEEFLRLVGAKK